MYCKNCGAEINDGAVVCVKCGCSVANPGKDKELATNLGLAIFSTLCCFPPLGIVSIVYSAQVNSKLLKGDVEGAKRSSKLAKNWAIAAIILGLAANLLYFILVLLQTPTGSAGVY